MQAHYYQHAGRINAPHGPISIVALAALTCLLAFLYATVLSQLRASLFNVFFTALFIWAFVAFPRYAAFTGHIRMQLFIRKATVALSLLFWYLHWLIYLIKIQPAPAGKGSQWVELLAFFRPELVVQSAIELHNYNMYHTGFPSWPIWLAEAVLLIAIPIWANYRRAPLPYSEKLGKWYQYYVIRHDFWPVTDAQMLETQLNASVPEAAEQMGNGYNTGRADMYLYYLEEEDTQYISIRNVFSSSHDDPEGGSSTNIERSFVMVLYAISTTDAHHLMDTYLYDRPRRPWSLLQIPGSRKETAVTAPWRNPA